MYKTDTIGTIPNYKKLCLYCGEDAVWKEGYGWTHKNGSMVIMACPNCDWIGNEPEGIVGHYDKDICPKCGNQGELYDHHTMNQCSVEHFAKYGEEMVKEINESNEKYRQYKRQEKERSKQLREKYQ